VGVHKGHMLRVPVRILQSIDDTMVNSGVFARPHRLSPIILYQRECAHYSPVASCVKTQGAQPKYYANSDILPELAHNIHLHRTV
jgi:hypothetical protein